jgi:1,4-alpha-glucan branching enzyme
MAGHDRDRFANLRLLMAALFSQPGKKLLFMGGEFGQGREWSHDRGLDWHLLDVDRHAGAQTWVEDLNRLYRASPALHALDCSPAGFQGVDCRDGENSVLSFLRLGGAARPMLVVLNFTPIPRTGYRVGVPNGGFWREALNSDAHRYAGSGWGNFGGVEAVPETMHGRPYSITLTLPPLGALFLTTDPAS